MRASVETRQRGIRKQHCAAMGAVKGIWFISHFWIAILFHVSINGAGALRGVQIRVPEAVRTGDTVKLACDYDLEQAALYTIKWYRQDQEFYRFVPKESPPTRVFPMQGIHVDISQSNAREVTLRDVHRDLTGFYKCEVSADAPLFHTEIKSAVMIVADLPDDNPSLSVEKLKYSLGEKIRANCTSHASFPAANLTWFVNGQQVIGSGQIRILLSQQEESSGLETACSRVELEASSGVFREGKLKLRCLATLFTLYRRSEEVELFEDTPQIAPVMGPTAPHSLGTNAGHTDLASRLEASLQLVIALCLTLILVLATR